MKNGNGWAAAVRLACAAVCAVAMAAAVAHAAPPDSSGVAGAAPTRGKKVHLHRFASVQMGMPFEILMAPPVEMSQDTLEMSAARAFGEISRLNSIFSDYEYDSELSRLSRSAGAGESRACSDELWDILQFSSRLHASTGGLFDITIGSATSLWRKARRDQAFPEARHLAMVRERVGMDGLKLDPRHRTATLLKENMRLDLGGVAKGVALDAAAGQLRCDGIESFMVRAGGDMVIGKAPPGEAGWPVILFPEEDVPAEHAPIRTSLLADCAIGTSGDVFQFVEIDGIRYSHIVDPETCIGLTEGRRAVVIAPSGIIADSHATVACLLGPDKLVEFIEREGAGYAFLEAHAMSHGEGGIRSAMTPGLLSFLNNPPDQ